MEIKNKNHQQGFTVIELMISTIIFSLILLAASAAIVEVGKKYYRGITNTRTQAASRTISEEIAQSLQYTSQAVKVPNYPDDDGDLYPDPTYNIYDRKYASQIYSGGGDGTEDLSTTGAVVDDTFYFCIGAKRYTYVLDKQIQPGLPHVFWVDEPEGGCAFAVDMGPADLTLDNPSNSSTYPGTNGRELLGLNMRVTEFEIIPKNNGLWTINLSLASGDTDLMLYTYFLDDLGAPTGEGRISCEGSTFGSEFCSTAEISLNVSKRIQ